MAGPMGLYPAGAVSGGILWAMAGVGPMALFPGGAMAGGILWTMPVVASVQAPESVSGCDLAPGGSVVVDGMALFGRAAEQKPIAGPVGMLVPQPAKARRSEA